MLVWLRAHAVLFCRTYWQERGTKEYELIYGEKPFAVLAHGDELLQKVKDIAEEIFPKTSRHWGQGKINPATWAWVFRQVNQRLRDNA
ncbi:hypothetical protein [Cyanobium sp. LEGE 06113]|uniref:hypothetical protein n=1 Tax=Cyanobium sp. LEGE 06113 TaxID=1297573 RepID=UPI00187EBD16|nr:hypothetical protein [Cyanobium sp. LEGE 06113]MBE9152565.1 hypothetical protein [Cyanobium sp. LEGE 06113]MBE9153230.1 hypothetical protein [Cyanobium sp. LEGE 06113]